MRIIDRSLIKESIEELKALQKKVSHQRDGGRNTESVHLKIDKNFC